MAATFAAASAATPSTIAGTATASATTSGATASGATASGATASATASGATASGATASRATARGGTPATAQEGVLLPKEDGQHVVGKVDRPIATPFTRTFTCHDVKLAPDKGVCHQDTEARGRVGA